LQKSLIRHRVGWVFQMKITIMLVRSGIVLT